MLRQSKSVWHNTIFLCLLGVALTHAGQGSAATINVMTINAEWLWTPFDNGVDGQKFNRGDMDPSRYQKEISFYSNLIKSQNVDVVAFSEIENEKVIEDIARAMGENWKGYFKQGRDTATGQDVGIVTRLPLKDNSVTDFDFPCAKVSGLTKSKCLSKVLGVTLELTAKGSKEVISVITSHFLSKRNDSRIKSLKRQAQALALAKAVATVEKKYGDKVIVLGDFNDHYSSLTLSALLQNGNLRNSISCNGKIPNASRIDHILYRGMECKRDSILSLQEFSDHNATFAEFVVH